MKPALWPVYGAALGGAGIALYISAIQFLPPAIAAVTVVVFWASVGQVVREDALFGAPRDRLSLIDIAVRFALAATWIAAFLHEGTSRVGVLRMTAGCLTAPTVARAAVVAMAWTSRPAAGGLELTARMRTSAMIIAALVGALAALIYGSRIGAGIIIGNYLILRAARGWFYNRHQGIDAADVEHTRLVAEGFTILLAVFGR